MWLAFAWNTFEHDFGFGKFATTTELWGISAFSGVQQWLQQLGLLRLYVHERAEKRTHALKRCDAFHFNS